jgi:hypothetical protein
MFPIFVMIDYDVSIRLLENSVTGKKEMMWNTIYSNVIIYIEELTRFRSVL